MKKLTKLMLTSATLSGLGAMLFGCSVYGADEYTITFVTNGGSAVSTMKVEWGKELELPANPTKTGYSFAGWYTDENLYNVLAEEIKVDEDLTLYAKWSINQYTVTYDVNGTSYKTVTQNYNTSVTVDAPSVEGYTFEGWYTDSSYKTKFDNTVPGNNVTVYSKWSENKVSITFDKNSELAVGTMEKQTIKYTDANKNLTVNAYTNEGYDFAGWSTTKTGTVEYADAAAYNFTDNGTITLYAVWTASDYTVSFVSNGVEYATKKGSYGGTVVAPETSPVRNGYTFEGWGTYVETEDTAFDGAKIYFTKVDTAYQEVTASVMESGVTYYELEDYTGTVPKNGIKLFARFVRNQYDVSFETNTTATIDKITAYYGSKLTAPETPTKEGYTFAGWYNNAEFTGNPYVFSTVPAENITLYGKWTVNSYSVSFNTNGGTKADKVTAEYDTVLSLPITTKTGYTFDGWYLDEDLTTAIADGYTTPSENVTLYAKWSANTDTAYTVNYYTANLDGSGNTLYDTDNMTGTTGEETEAEAAEIEGFTAKKFSQKKIAADGSTVIDIYYTRNTYTVTFVDEEDTTIKEITGIAYEDTLGTLPTELVKTGYTYALSDSFTATTVVTKDTKVVVTYTVRELSIAFYNYPEAENSFEQTVEYAYDTEVTLPTATKTGYTFNGWAISADGEVVYGLTDLAIKMPADSLDLYAVWTVNSYTITFASNGGSEVAAITKNYADTVTMPENPTKAGYTFVGWYGNEELTGNIVSYSSMPASDVTLYASWQINSYTVEFNSNGGTNYDSLTKEYNTALELPIPEKTGYTFAGWYKDASLTEAYTSTVFDEDVSLYAKWNINSYTVKYVSDGKEVFNSTLDYNSTYSVPANPAKDMDDTYYYTFAGWKLNDTVVSLNDTEKVAAEDRTYEATFAKSTYKTQMQNAYGGTIICSFNGNGQLTDNDKIEALFISNYIASLYEYQTAYSQIHTAIQAAVGGDTSGITAIGTYFTVVKNLTAANAITTVKTDTEKQTVLYYLTLSASSGGAGLNAATAQNLLTAYSCINYIDDAEYIDAVLNFGSNQEVLANNTSARLDSYSSMILKYEASAYTPYSNEDKVFDGWGRVINASDTENVVVSYYAKWVSKAETPKNVSVSSITSKSVTIKWNAVDNAYGYEVKTYDKDNNLLKTVEVTANSYTLDELTADEVVSFTVATISANADGSERKTSAQYTATSLKDSSALTSSTISLTSAPSSKLTYTHVVSANEDITASGDYYYVGESGTLYVFTNTSYSFNNVTAIEITEGSQYASVVDGALVIGSNSGTVKFNITRADSTVESKTAVIRLLANSIELGDSLYSYESTVSKIGTDDSEYLSDTKENFAIGKSRTDSTITTDYSSKIDGKTYRNGFKFDFEVSTTSGSYLDSSAFKFDYTFEVSADNGTTWTAVTDTSDLFVYDDENDVFYFLKNSGLYRVTVTYAADDSNTGYVNTSLPNAYKTKVMTKSFTFELNNGVNVFTDDGLKEAYAASTVELINLENDIEAELDTNQVGYLPYLIAHGNYSLDEYPNYVGGELDVKEGTAVLENSSFGPKVWKQVSSQPTDGYYLTDATGNYYVYDATNGDLALVDCEWVENYGAGHFKIDNVSLTGLSKYTAIGLRTGSIYTRTGTKTDVVINGNYFTIDGSDLPCVTSSGSVSLSGFTASYHIQHGMVALIEAGNEASTTIKNVSLVSNTQDSSAYLNGNSGDESSIAEFMSRTSGGYNAIKLDPADTTGNSTTTPVTTQLSVLLENTNISNSLIAAYVDDNATFKANNTHIRQTWANAMYSYRGGSIEFTNSKVESSGGASFHIDENYYSMDTLGYATNSEMYLDFLSLDQANYVSGEEQWFKAYSMEVLALGMKSQIESGLSAAGYTILETVTDPSTGLETEKMNFVYLSKNAGISDQTTKNSSDLFAQIDYDTCSKDTKVASGVLSKPVSASYSLTFDLYQKSNGDQYLYCADTNVSAGNTVIIKIPYVNGAAVEAETQMYAINVTAISSTQKMITYIPLNADLSANMSAAKYYFYMDYPLGSYSISLILEAKKAA